jgi:hypothetical protein
MTMNTHPYRSCAIGFALLASACNRESIHDDMQDLKAKQHALAEQVQDEVDKARDNLHDKLPAARERLREEVQKTRDEVHETLQNARVQLRRRADDAKRAAHDYVDR